MSQEVCTRSMVRNKKPEAERASQNQEYQENKRSKAEERTKDACSPQKSIKENEKKASRRTRRKLLICLRKFVQEAWSETRTRG